jgi:hypothetical protein
MARFLGSHGDETSPWRWSQQVPLKRRSISTRLQRERSQKNASSVIQNFLVNFQAVSYESLNAYKVMGCKVALKLISWTHILTLCQQTWGFLAWGTLSRNIQDGEATPRQVEPRHVWLTLVRNAPKAKYKWKSPEANLLEINMQLLHTYCYSVFKLVQI